MDNDKNPQRVRVKIVPGSASAPGALTRALAGRKGKMHAAAGRWFFHHRRRARPGAPEPSEVENTELHGRAGGRAPRDQSEAAPIFGGRCFALLAPRSLRPTGHQ
jgi:hypothetical protein